MGILTSPRSKIIPDTSGYESDVWTHYSFDQRIQSLFAVAWILDAGPHSSGTHPNVTSELSALELACLAVNSLRFSRTLLQGLHVSDTTRLNLFDTTDEVLFARYHVRKWPLYLANMLRTFPSGSFRRHHVTFCPTTLDVPPALPSEYKTLFSPGVLAKFATFDLSTEMKHQGYLIPCTPDLLYAAIDGMYCRFVSDTIGGSHPDTALVGEHDAEEFICTHDRFTASVLLPAARMVALSLVCVLAKAVPEDARSRIIPPRTSFGLGSLDTSHFVGVTTSNERDQITGTYDVAVCADAFAHLNFLLGISMKEEPIAWRGAFSKKSRRSGPLANVELRNMLSFIEALFEIADLTIMLTWWEKIGPATEYQVARVTTDVTTDKRMEEFLSDSAVDAPQFACKWCDGYAVNLDRFKQRVFVDGVYGPAVSACHKLFIDLITERWATSGSTLQGALETVSRYILENNAEIDRHPRNSTADRIAHQVIAVNCISTMEGATLTRYLRYLHVPLLCAEGLRKTPMTSEVRGYLTLNHSV